MSNRVRCQDCDRPLEYCQCRKPSPSPQMKDRKPSNRSHTNALRLFNEGVPFGCSTDIGGDTSYGYGVLDEYGFWEFPLFFDVEPSPAKDKKHTCDGCINTDCPLFTRQNLVVAVTCNDKRIAEPSPEPMPLIARCFNHNEDCTCVFCLNQIAQRDADMAWHLEKVQQVQKDFAEECIKVILTKATNVPSGYKEDSPEFWAYCDGSNARASAIIAHLRAMGEKR